MLNLDRRGALLGAPLLLQAAAAHAGTTPASRPVQPWAAARDGTPLHVLDWGRGPAVVFVHAWAIGSALWEYCMTALVERGLRAVAFDRRGHGRSPDPGRGYDFATLADDLGSVLDALDLRDVTLVGHSMGCTEIANYLLRHGSARVSRVVFVSAAGPEAGGAMLEPFLAGLAEDRPGFLARSAQLFTGASIAPTAPLAQWALSQFLQASPLATRECLKLALQTPLRPALGAVRVPALFVHGGQDALSPMEVSGALTAREIPGSRLVVIKDAPHGLPVTHHRQLTAELLDFMGSGPPARSAG